MPIGEVEIILDSTIHYTVTDAGGGNTILQPRERLDYSRPTEDTRWVVTLQYTGGAWLREQQLRTTFDDRDRIIRELKVLWSDTLHTWVPDQQLFRYPRGASPTVVDSLHLEIYQPSEDAWRAETSIWNTFDTSGHVQQTVSRTWVGDEHVWFTDYYGYDERGDNHEIHTYVQQDTGLLWVNYTQQTFEDHRLVTYTLSQVQAAALLPLQRIQYNYTASGQADTTVTSRWDPNNDSWIMNHRVTYEYGPNDLQTDTYEEYYIHQVHPDQPDISTWRHYQYLEGTPFLEREDLYRFDSLVNGYRREEHTRHYYRNTTTGVVSRGQHALPLATWPNPATSWVAFRLPEAARVWVTDPLGRVVLTYAAGAGESRLELNALPPGVYRLMAWAPNRMYHAVIYKRDYP
ncbi:hypothetical protein CGL56_10770 [Neolewinella marina]|uniref:Secretion system C-terminal sorting domain-containing protein n=1 Tax=Neolewinella marina TaxID=438751 RepID=A0A2G0CDX2_9BACT|nr:hypothetical protein CGL56_10770 [Neolewinella marina]